jgi:Ser/Thr protein kinase RdoA (MazF antagonist)
MRKVAFDLFFASHAPNVADVAMAVAFWNRFTLTDPAGGGWAVRAKY